MSVVPHTAPVRQDSRQLCGGLCEYLQGRRCAPSCPRGRRSWRGRPSPPASSPPGPAQHGHDTVSVHLTRAVEGSFDFRFCTQLPCHDVSCVVQSFRSSGYLTLPHPAVSAPAHSIRRQLPECTVAHLHTSPALWPCLLRHMTQQAGAKGKIPRMHLHLLQGLTRQPGLIMETARRKATVCN